MARPLETLQFLTPKERARRYLSAIPPAVQGGGGYDQTGRAVWVVVNDFGLSGDEAFELLQEWNAGCSPPWKERDILQAIQRAERHIGGPDYGAKGKPLTAKERQSYHLRQVTSLPPEMPDPPDDPTWREKLHGTEHLSGTPGADYLESRGIPAELAHGAGVRYHPAWYDRPAVLFPFRGKPENSTPGALLAVEGRYIDGMEKQDPSKPKGRSAGQKGRGVFATPGAISADLVIIVEGSVDALTLALCGYPSIALGGCHWPAWLPKVCSWKRVLIATDNDQAGDQAAEKLARELLARGAKPDRLSPSPAKDWNDALTLYGADALRQALARLQEAKEETDDPEWDPELADLVAWFGAGMDAGSLPPDTHDGLYVRLVDAIDAGRNGEAARSGVLYAELARLREKVQSRTFSSARLEE
jgi:5S rRNA maturation endonuclease (ribonuclease M5)